MMYLKENMSVDNCIELIKKDFRDGNVLRNVLYRSAPSTLIELQTAMPDFLEASIAYIKLAENLVKDGFVPEQKGICTPSSEERKAVIKSFSINSEARQKLFSPTWYITSYEWCVYQLLEAVFDASLLVEQSAQRRFREMVDLYRSFVPVRQFGDCCFSINPTCILYIDLDNGCVYELIDDEILNKLNLIGAKEVTYETDLPAQKNMYYLKLKNDEKIELMVDGVLSEKFNKCNFIKDYTKDYVQIRIQPRIGETPAVQFPVHIVLLLAKFGINTMKHFLLKDGLITCDHLDMHAGNNLLQNLALVTRKDNKLRATGKDKEVLEFVCNYNFKDFFNHIEACQFMHKVDVRLKEECLHDYWNKQLVDKTVEEIFRKAS